MSKKPSVGGMSRKQRAAVMIAIRTQQAGRSPRAVSMDARQTARRSLDPETDDLYPWQRNPNRYDVHGVDTQIIEKPKPEQDSVKIITKNLPNGYEIHKWSYIDRAGKQTVHAVIFEGEPIFGQNKTFGSLTDARKAVKEHSDTQRLLKQVREEREYFKKYGHLGKTGYIT